MLCIFTLSLAAAIAGLLPRGVFPKPGTASTALQQCCLLDDVILVPICSLQIDWRSSVLKPHLAQAPLPAYNRGA